MPARFLTRAEVAEELNVSESQVYARIQRVDLRHIKVGGRAVYRIERSELEACIQRAYEETARAHALTSPELCLLGGHFLDGRGCPNSSQPAKAR